MLDDKDLKKFERLFYKTPPIKEDPGLNLQDQLSRIENTLYQLMAAIAQPNHTRKPLWVKARFIQMLTIFKTKTLMHQARLHSLIKWSHDEEFGFRYDLHSIDPLVFKMSTSSDLGNRKSPI
jgi:hypothetical protein